VIGEYQNRGTRQSIAAALMPVLNLWMKSVALCACAPLSHWGNVESAIQSRNGWLPHICLV
jgi:hypothetical protein